MRYVRGSAWVTLAAIGLASSLQAQEPDDGVEVVRPQPQGAQGAGGWWHRQLEANRARHGQPAASPMTVSGQRTAARPISADHVTTAATPAPVATADAAFGPTAGHARLSAPLYPCPLPNIPLETGSVMYTNPAFAPHEMLYAHEYRGLYPPFYHKTTRGWILTPFGVYKKEKRVLTGTEVHVKYKSHISPFALFSPRD